MQGSNRIAGVNYNMSGADVVTNANCSSLYTHSYGTHPLYLQVQALERENSGLRAKLEALTSATGGQFAVPRMPKSTALSSRVTRIVEEEVERITKKYNDAVARKNIYKKRYLKLISTIKNARNSVRIVLDVARLHQHPTLLQAVHNIEDSLMLSWPNDDISDYEQANLETASAPQLPLTMSIQEVYDSKEHKSASSPHNSPRSRGDGDMNPPYYGAVRMEQRPSALTKLSPILKREQHVQAHAMIQKEKEDAKRDSYVHMPLNTHSNRLKQENKDSSFDKSGGLSESSYLANSSLLLALEKRVASEVAGVVQSAYERHIRNTKPSDSCASISASETSNCSPSVPNNSVDSKSQQYGLTDPSELLDRNMTPSLSNEQTSQSPRGGGSASIHSNLSLPPVTDIVTFPSTHSIHMSASTSISAPVILPLSNLSNQSYESIEALVTLEHSQSNQPSLANAKPVGDVECNTSLPSLSSSGHMTRRSSKNISNTSQSVSINSFICGINEIADDCSVTSNVGGPLMVFSPRAEEYISQVSSISTNNRVSTNGPADPINGSHVQQIFKTHGSKAALSAVAKSVESDMFVSDVNVMKQTARQQQIAATKLLESKGAENSDIMDPQPQDLESTESMGLIIDRSRAAAGINNMELSAYLSEALLARSRDMGVTSDIADFCLSRPITADQDAVQHISAPTSAVDPSNDAFLTTAMLDQSPLVLENSIRSQGSSMPSCSPPA